jgi:hypothetical protein
MAEENSVLASANPVFDHEAASLPSEPSKLASDSSALATSDPVSDLEAAVPPSEHTVDITSQSVAPEQQEPKQKAAAEEVRDCDRTSGVLGMGFCARVKQWFTHDTYEGGHTHKGPWILTLEYALLLFALFWFIVMIGTMIKLFTDAPFELFFWGYSAAIVIYLLSSAALIALWVWSSNFSLRILAQRARFWVFVTTLTIGIIGLIFLCVLMFPDAFGSRFVISKLWLNEFMF